MGQRAEDRGNVPLGLTRNLYVEARGWKSGIGGGRRKKGKGNRKQEIPRYARDDRRKEKAKAKFPPSDGEGWGNRRENQE